jgi:hypothetical protein
MATIAIEVVAAQTTTHTRTVSNADLVRVRDAERILRNMPSATQDQILAELANDFFSRLKARVRQAEQRTAEEAAAAAVTEISLT